MFNLSFFYFNKNEFSYIIPCFLLKNQYQYYINLIFFNGFCMYKINEGDEKNKRLLRETFFVYILFKIVGADAHIRPNCGAMWASPPTRK